MIEADAGGGPDDRRCWRRETGCSWARAGFRFDEDLTSNLGDSAAYMANFTADACTVIYHSANQLWFRDRTGPGAPFSMPTPIELALDATVHLSGASLAPSRLELVFLRDEPAVPRPVVLYRATRLSEHDPWSVPTRALDLSFPAAVSTFEYDPFFAPSGRAFYYAPRLVVGGQLPYVATRSSSAPGVAFGAPTPVDIGGLELPPVDSVYRPTITQDELALLFGTFDSDRRLLYSTRSTPSERWGTAQPFPSSIFTTSRLVDAAVSADGCEVVVRLDDSRVVHLVYHDP